jgi:hypothetical protein
MTAINEKDLATIRKPESPEKMRVTFFITKSSKAALKAWCLANKVSESGAVDLIIKTTVPKQYFAETGQGGVNGAIPEGK